jgi:hypothetical protein
MIPPGVGHSHCLDHSTRDDSIVPHSIRPYRPLRISHATQGEAIFLLQDGGAVRGSLVLTTTSRPVLAVRSVRKFTLAPVTISSGIRGDDRALGMKFRVLVQSIATNGRNMAAKSYPFSFLSSSRSHTTLCVHFVFAGDSGSIVGTVSLEEERAGLEHCFVV